MDVAILITLLVNMLVLGGRVVADFALKRKDVKVLKMQMREDKRIAVYEDIYGQMKFIQHNLRTSKDEERQSARISRLTKTSNLSGLYLTERAELVIRDFIDYSISVTGGGALSDLEREKTVFADFEEEFKG